MVLTRELAVLVKQLFPRLRSPQVLQVHHERGHVTQHVSVPQCGVKVEAVQNPWTVGHAEDVVGEQVPVAVSHLPGGDPPGEQGAASADVGVDVAAGLSDFLPVKQLRISSEGVEPQLPQFPKPVWTGDGFWPLGGGAA